MTASSPNTNTGRLPETVDSNSDQEHEAPTERFERIIFIEDVLSNIP